MVPGQRGCSNSSTSSNRLCSVSRASRRIIVSYTNRDLDFACHLFTVARKRVLVVDNMRVPTKNMPPVCHFSSIQSHRLPAFPSRTYSPQFSGGNKKSFHRIIIPPLFYAQ